MSYGGAHEDEMGRLLRLHDRDLDRLLAGRAPADNGDLDELAAFVRELTHTFQAAPDPATETRHLNAIMTRSGRFLQPIQHPSKRRMGRPARYGGAAGSEVGCGPCDSCLRGFSRSGCSAAVLYAGALPGPVQGAVADFARNVGVSLPGAHNDKDDGPQNDKQDGQPNIVPGNTQTDTNGTAETDGAQDDGAPLNQKHGEQRSQSDERGGSQQHRGSAQNRGNDAGESGNSGTEDRASPVKGRPPGVARAPGTRAPAVRARTTKAPATRAPDRRAGCRVTAPRAMATRAMAAIEASSARPRRPQGS